MLDVLSRHEFLKETQHRSDQKAGALFTKQLTQTARNYITPAKIKPDELASFQPCELPLLGANQSYIDQA